MRALIAWQMGTGPIGIAPGPMLRRRENDHIE